MCENFKINFMCQFIFYIAKIATIAQEILSQ